MRLRRKRGQRRHLQDNGVLDIRIEEVMADLVSKGGRNWQIL